MPDIGGIAGLGSGIGGLGGLGTGGTKPPAAISSAR